MGVNLLTRCRCFLVINTPQWPAVNLLLFFLGAYHPSNMLVYLRNGSAWTVLHAATLSWEKLQIKLAISPSHSTLYLLYLPREEERGDWQERERERERGLGGSGRSEHKRVKLIAFTANIVQSEQPVNYRWIDMFDCVHTRGRYHGGRRPSSDDSFHSPTIIPPSALDKPSIMKRYHRRQTCSHTSPCRSLTMVTLYDTRFVECRWWNDGWTVKTVVTWRSSASMIPALGVAWEQPIYWYTTVWTKHLHAIQPVSKQLVTFKIHTENTHPQIYLAYRIDFFHWRYWASKPTNAFKVVEPFHKILHEQKRLCGRLDFVEANSPTSAR